MTTLVAINPGTGPVNGVVVDAATANMAVLLEDAGVSEATFERVESDDEDGRFSFMVTLGERRCSVDMPGIPLDRVRFVGADGQNIWHFPRLYVDGSSWVWCYAVSQLSDELRGERDEE